MALEPTPEQQEKLDDLCQPRWSYQDVGMEVQVRAIWDYIRDQVLEAVLDRIDEDRNPTAYGACGCTEAVRSLKG